MVPRIDHKNNNIFVDVQELVSDSIAKTQLTSDVTAGSSTLTVKAIKGFAVNQVLLIGGLGGEASEIIKTHASTTPSSKTVTLASATINNHPAGTPVYVLRVDQIELSHATTLTGSKSTLTTTIGSGLIGIEADTVRMVYNEDEQTSGFYFARYKNSISGNFEAYTDGLPYGGWDKGTVGSIVLQSLKNNLLKRFTRDISLEFCLGHISDVLQKVQGKQLRWPQHQSFNKILGQTSRGVNVVSFPTDIYTTKSNKSLMALRIGDNKPLEYQDPYEFEAYLDGVTTTQVRTEASASDTTLAIDNSYDFADSGIAIVYVAGVKYSITYTGVTRSATVGVLTGVPSSGDGSISITIPVDTNVWQGEDEGFPEVFTVRNDQIEFYPLADAQFDNQNIRGDYWTVADSVNSMGDTIDDDRYDLVLYWLSWRIRMVLKNEGQLDPNDGFYQEFKVRLEDKITFKGRGAQRKNKHSGFMRWRTATRSKLADE